MKVWAFYYNGCIHESSWATVSLHISKENAEKAMNEHKDKAKIEHDEYANRCKADDLPYPEFGTHEGWAVNDVEVLP